MAAGLQREHQWAASGTDLSIHSAEHLAAITQRLDTRPRKGLGWLTPAEVWPRIYSAEDQVLRRPLEFARRVGGQFSAVGDTRHLRRLGMTRLAYRRNSSHRRRFPLASRTKKSGCVHNSETWFLRTSLGGRLA